MAAATSTPSARAAVERLIAPWTRACLERDWDSLLAMCTDDIVFMPHGSPPVTGEDVRPWLDGFPTIKAMSWDVARAEEAGDLAFVRGSVRQTLEIDGEVVEMDGKYCDLFRREEDRVWRFAVIIWNQNDG
jgi:ketosteroid isomerase-like protein